MTILDTANALLRDKEDEKPTRQEAENAVKVLIEWAGDDPSREGLIETPSRVIKSFEEYFDGYTKNPEKILSKTFSEIEDYKEFVLLKNISFLSHCEHHMAPIIGSASVAYIPENCVVGISKLARVVQMFAKRLQTQETMTSQIANTIQSILKPKGVAVLISAEHFCMTSRGVNIKDTNLVTSHFTGDFSLNPALKESFLEHLKNF